MLLRFAMLFYKVLIICQCLGPYNKTNFLVFFKILMSVKQTLVVDTKNVLITMEGLNVLHLCNAKQDSNWMNLEKNVLVSFVFIKATCFFLKKKYLPDVNECTRGTHKCNPTQICKNYQGYYTCECPTGHHFNKKTDMCEDMDECKIFRVRYALFSSFSPPFSSALCFEILTIYRFFQSSMDRL